MLLSVIIVSYNTQALTIQTLASVMKNVLGSPLLNGQTEIIVIDNHSTDDSVKTVKSHFPQVKIIKNETNTGFAQANNQGLAVAKGKYLLLLNSDTIVQANALDKLINYFEHHPINDQTAALKNHNPVDRLGILAASLLNPDRTPQPQGGSLPNLGKLAVQQLMLDDLPLIGRFFPTTQETGRSYQLRKKTQSSQSFIPKEWVAGTAMLIRRQVIDEIGALDSHIFMYGEDIEFCLRAKAHHWDISELSTAQIIHLGSASSSSANAIKGELDAYIYIWAKHFPAWQLPLVKLLIKIGCLFRLLVFGTMKRDFKKVNIYQQYLK